MHETYSIDKTDRKGNPTRRYWKLVYNAALRLGVALPLDTVITLEFVGEEYPNTDLDKAKHDEKNERFLGTLTLNNRKFPDIIFVHTTRYKRPKFITFYPKLEDESASEGTVEPLVTIALKDDPIPPSEVVKEMHPEFVKNPAINPIILINRLKNIAEKKVNELRGIAEQWAKEKKAFEDKIKRLEEEVTRLKAEKAKAAAGGNKVVENEAKILRSVDTDVLIANSPNTVLIFEDGSQKTMKVSTWDKNLSVTKKAKSLIGKKVITTCWDPINEPGKWSNRNYFRNIYEVA